MNITVADVVSALHEAFPPSLAEDWDKVGLTVGDPQAPVRTVGFAVDPCEATINEAIERGADILITHHPLFLRGTSFVAADSAKGSWVHRLIKNDVALLAAHTNADSAQHGSADALADILSLEDRTPLDPIPENDALGIGRIGSLPLTMSVREVAERLKDQLPQTAASVLVGGDPERIVKRVAVSPGSGDSYLAAADDAGAELYITADLRHHPASDHLWSGGCALIGLTHFASEWPVLPQMKAAIEARLDVGAYVSTLVTDPWTLRI